MSFFWRADDRNSVDMLPGIRRRLISAGERAMAVRVELTRGSKLQSHTHPHEQIGFVVSGRIRFNVAGETMLLEGGDGYSIPGGVVHSVEEVAEDSVVVDVFSPVREEYLS